MKRKGKGGEERAELEKKAAELGLVLTDPAAIGRKGGRNSRKNLKPEERTALARKAAKARWGKKKSN
jgi:hypothetical protein